jgi:hypothetical protein
MGVTVRFFIENASLVKSVDANLSRSVNDLVV